MRVNPVGASTSGYASGWPNNVVDGSAASTPRNTRGRNITLRVRVGVRRERAFVLGGAVDVVEHAAWEATAGDAPQVGDARDPLESARDGIGLEAAEPHDRTQRVEHGYELCGSRSSSRDAASMSARWVNACGKLPRW